MRRPLIVYDIEIIKAPPPRRGERLPDIEYCEGWHDHANIGISVISAYDFREDRFRVFLKDNFEKFEALAANRRVCGFNSISFDDRVCDANGIKVTTEVDLLVEIWKAAGLGPDFEDPSHAGFGLDAVAKANGLSGKTGHGALAPVLWQRGQYGEVIDYCLEDTNLTQKLLRVIAVKGGLISPKHPGDLLPFDDVVEVLQGL